jgi:hypothetical protein
MNAAAQIDTEADLDAQSSKDRIKGKLLRVLSAEVLALFSAPTTVELPLLSAQDNAHGR